MRSAWMWFGGVAGVLALAQGVGCLSLSTSDGEGAGGAGGGSGGTIVSAVAGSSSSATTSSSGGGSEGSGGGPTATCSDNMQNGDETGVDCGGKCPKCNGDACSGADECKSSFCADGVCCDVACTGTCQSCDQMANVGACSNVPSGSEDPGVCTISSACDGAGACKLKNGQVCDGDAQCLSNNCTGAPKTCSP